MAKSEKAAVKPSKTYKVDLWSMIMQVSALVGAVASIVNGLQIVRLDGRVKALEQSKRRTKTKAQPRKLRVVKSKSA